MTPLKFPMEFPNVRCRKCGQDVPVMYATPLVDSEDRLSGWECLDRDACERMDDDE